LTLRAHSWDYSLFIKPKIMINWDAHACLPQHPLADFTPVRRLHAAGVNYVSLNVGADMNPVSQVMSVIAGYRATIAANPERYVLVSSVDDIIQAAADGRIAITFDLEGSMPLLDQPDMVALYATGRAPDPLRLQPQQQRGRRLPRRGTRPDAARPSHGAGGERQRHPDGLFAHGPPVQPGDHERLVQAGDFQPRQPVHAGAARPQRHR
jgi:hypothetical protein